METHGWTSMRIDTLFFVHKICLSIGPVLLLCPICPSPNALASVSVPSWVCLETQALKSSKVSQKKCKNSTAKKVYHPYQVIYLNLIAPNTLQSQFLESQGKHINHKPN